MRLVFTSLSRMLARLVMVGSIIAGGPTEAQAQELAVTVTNVTKAQYFTPLLVVSHTDDFYLFGPGEVASNALEQLAEGGDTGPLLETLEGRLDVHDAVTADGLLGPGETITFELSSGSQPGRFAHVSLAGMLLPTNDTFVGVNSASRPRRARQTVRVYAPAYDAGTEANDELCANIPGSFNCDGTGEGYNPSRDGAEGGIYISNGIQGIGDLDAPLRNWRNPVAIVTIDIIQ